MKKKKPKLEDLDIVSEGLLTSIATIIGEHSAASQALKDILERRAKGEDPICVNSGSSFVVFDRKTYEEWKWPDC